ncbi:FAD-dependent monooxygenase [Kitasatospora viridis]|uniref:2-polyprenyl-6-methoxyphenol hydroxylase-like FAD-dependent oxidoreductase n=1 Tax=Kitasatospora viridis TaxID=281105 RepID=A0A561UN46_9ACTN|nr:FAD-dependent monooxygenase [Kitasatospora viridis]TWG00791.1 2-polyprenyl-6-methoxyphenol hydroxylase-like FAD-dependent oxidoreductase [Kitasatospora viridis]
MPNDTANDTANDAVIDVAVIGAGPNGLLLACELALAGVRPVVFEKLAEPGEAQRANGVVGQVVRLLDHRGLHQRITGGDQPPAPAPGFMFAAFPLDLAELDPNPVHLLTVPQPRLEALLAERAAELGVEVRRGHELRGLRQDPDGVDLELDGPDGAVRVRARYLVGCDGGHSTVRRLAGITFPGVPGPGVVSRAAHATLPPEWIDPESGELVVPGHGRVPYFRFYRTEQGVFIFASPDPKRPLISTLEWGEPPADPELPLTLEEMSASIERVLGAPVPLTPPTGPGPHLLRRHVNGNTRLADRYREGRVLIAGDAAHVHSAVGGPGLNLGMQDVANLGWKLAADLRGWAPPGLLDTYQSERYPLGERVYLHSQAQLALMAPGPEVTALRALFGELLAAPENTRRIADLIAGSDVRYPVACPHPLAGRFAPEFPLDGPRLAELMHRARPLLLDLTPDQWFLPVARGWRDRVTAHAATSSAAPAAALLVRPDGYVAWAADPEEDADTGGKALRAALTDWFGEPVDG